MPAHALKIINQIFEVREREGDRAGLIHAKRSLGAPGWGTIPWMGVTREEIRLFPRLLTMLDPHGEPERADDGLPADLDEEEAYRILEELHRLCGWLDNFSDYEEARVAINRALSAKQNSRLRLARLFQLDNREEETNLDRDKRATRASTSVKG